MTVVVKFVHVFAGERQAIQASFKVVSFLSVLRRSVIPTGLVGFRHGQLP
jgi:hypothetical protein